MTQPLIAVLPFCQKDTNEALRLLDWIKTLDGRIETHALLLVADDAVPLEQKKAVNDLGKTVFANSEMAIVKAPAPVGTNYAPPAATMFGRAVMHIDECYKWNFVWLEPDAVPLRSGWLDALAEAYTACPKRFMGSIAPTDKGGTIMFGTAVYPNCCGPELQKYCDGKNHFDKAMSDFTVPRGTNSPLFHHRWGAPGDPPTFKDLKMPADGPNVGTLDMVPKEAVLFHRNKDGTLIELLRKQLGIPQVIGTMEVLETPEQWQKAMGLSEQKRRPGRPPKLPQPDPERLMP